MAIKFRKVKIGFVNLLWDGVSNHEKAEKAANDAKKYLEEKLDAQIVETGKSISCREDGIEAWKKFKAEDVDGVILFNGTYSTGEIATEILRNLDLPYAFWGIPELGLATNDVTGSMIGLMPAGTAAKYFGRKFSFLYGTIEDKEVKKRISTFTNAVRLIAYLSEAKIGYIGVRPDGFEICNYDELAIKERFGTEITTLSLLSFVRMMDDITDAEIDADMKIQNDIFSIASKHQKESRELSRVYLGLRKYIDDNKLQALAVGCWPEFRNTDKRPFCAAHGRLNAEGIMTGCEGDVDGSITMMAQYVLSGGKAPWWADFTGFFNGTTHWWHCGNAPHCNSVKKPIIDYVYDGLAQNASMMDGKATVCRFNSIRGEYLIHAGVGESKDQGTVLKGSNMFVEMNCGNMNYIESLLENGVPHHNGLVYGDISKELTEYAKLTGIELVVK